MPKPEDYSPLPAPPTPAPVTPPTPPPDPSAAPEKVSGTIPSPEDDDRDAALRAVRQLEQ
jgi:hypothetical protein